jgi:hypothetical protein
MRLKTKEIWQTFLKECKSKFNYEPLKNDVSITERDGYTYFTFYDKKSKRDIN